MIVEKYNDLVNVQDNMVVDLSRLNPKQFMMAIGFLSGLTCRMGSLKKISRNKYLVKLGE